MSRSKVVAFGLLVVVGFSGTAIVLGPSGIAGDPEPDTFTRVKVLKSALFTTCGGDTCVGTGPAEFAFEVPVGLGTYDLLVQLTVEYRTSRGDDAQVVVRHKEGSGTFAEVPPGPLQLRSGTLTTTTLTWRLKDLVSSDETHVVDWRPQVVARDGNYSVRLQRSILVVTAIPSA